MIYQFKSNITGIYGLQKNIVAVYYGSSLVWTNNNKAASCFGNGYWIDENPWTDDLSWTD